LLGRDIREVISEKMIGGQPADEGHDMQGKELHVEEQGRSRT
jgi:hypothetical protein